MRRTLKDSFRKVRALRARELREVWSSLFFLARFLFYIGTFDYNAFFKYNYCRNFKEVIFMGKFIEEFYYGNLDPQARSTKQNKAVQKQMEVLMLNEDYLTENLSGENKKKFLEFVNAWGIVNGESNLDSFIMGFRLGANFTYDTFVSDEAPFMDLLKE